MLDICKMIAAAADAVAETFWPTRCVGCDLPGVFLCPDCQNALPLIDLESACPRCGAPYANYVCTECMPPGALDRANRALPYPFMFSSARAAVSYEGVGKKLIRAYKDAGERGLAPLIGEYIADAARGVCSDGTQLEDWSQWADALVAAPPTPGSLKRRGYDHMAPIAQEVSMQLEVPLLSCLESTKAADQRALSQEQRRANRQGSIRCIAGEVPPRVLFIDDVLTTGATADAAAAALLEAGALEVRVAVFARVW